MQDVLDPEELQSRKAALEQLLGLMSEAVRADGGDLVLADVDYDAGIVEVRLEGACGSCAVSGMTLKGGVERLLKDRLAWVSEVRGSVDESMDFNDSVSLGRGGYVRREP